MLRFVVPVLFAGLAFGAPPVAAESLAPVPVAPSELELELVDVFVHTGQALVYDQRTAEYVLLRTGARHRGFKVASLAAGQIEFFRAGNSKLRYVLTRSSKDAAKGAPIDPYGDLVSPWEATSTPPAAALPKPEPEPEPEAIKRVRAPVESRVAAPTRALIGRAELDRALDDLDRMSREVEIEAADGGTRVVNIGEGTLPYRLGLRRGDVVVSIDGIATNSIEAGADVYVRLTTSSKFDIRILRESEPVVISVSVQSKR